MASFMGGDFVEAYVLKNAYKEKMRRMDAAEAAALQGKDVKDSAGATGSAAGERKATTGSRGGFFGLMKKKVHPKAAPSS